MKITTRADLNVGLICNIKCQFCYDLDHLNKQKGPSLEQLRKKMQTLKAKGMSTIDLTGGEATVRKDLIDIIRMVKEEFGIQNICLITNGFKLADKKYMDQVVQAGVNEFLFSIHGASAEIHDYLADVKGSFDRVVKALKEANQLGIKLRVNTTVTSKNYDRLNDIASMISNYRIENYNMIMYNPILDATRRVDQLAIRYSIAAPFLKDVIDRYKHRFQHIHAKYIPFCFMSGYEEHVMNLLQSSYIPYEWNFSQRSKSRRGTVVHSMATGAGLISCMDVRAVWQRDLHEIMQDSFISFQEMTNKYKPSQCRSCKFSLICHGLWKGYYNSFGANELTPVEGQKVLRPYHFMMTDDGD